MAYGLRQLVNRFWTEWYYSRALRGTPSQAPVFESYRTPWGCGGHPDHFYHFVFDFLLPVVRYRLHRSHFSPHLLELLGDFRPIAEELIPKGIYSSIDVSHGKTAQLVGMNPRCVTIRRSDLVAMVRHVFGAYKIRRSAGTASVLVIERGAPSEHHVTKSPSRGGGASRRSILNHGEFFHTIKRRLGPDVAIRNVQLETIPFREQVQLFANAQTVIGQHGAGLANMIWMRTGSRVIELSHSRKLKHFSIVAGTMGHRYRRYGLSSAHTQVPCDHFGDWLVDTGTH